MTSLVGVVRDETREGSRALLYTLKLSHSLTKKTLKFYTVCVYNIVCVVYYILVVTVTVSAVKYQHTLPF